MWGVRCGVEKGESFLAGQFFLNVGLGSLFLLIPMSGGVLVFRYASHSGVSSGWSSMDTGSSRGAAAAGGDECDDGVASIGDRTGVTTGAWNFGVNVSRKSCSQPGSAVTSGVSLGTVVVGIMTGVEVGGARGMSSGRSVPGLYELVGVGALPTLDTGGVLDLDFCLISVTWAPTNGCKSPWMTLKHLIRESNLPKSDAVKSAGVTIPAVTPTFSSPSRPAASPEVPRDTSSGHVPLGSHVIHPRAPSSRPMPRDPVSRPRWVRL